ncbi:hypothetical protein [Saccharomonospora piscinae]|uniref:hypothetical protein n=1 Tax=Saccharomonospora piscinae TaxID=687388 RepID=UPI0026B72502
MNDTWLRGRQQAMPGWSSWCASRTQAVPRAISTISSKHLAPAIAVTAVQYPGRQDRINEDGFADVVDAADAVAGEL